MTPFEMAVTSTGALLLLTNMKGLAHHPKLGELPRWYVFVVLTALVAVIASYVNLIFNGVFS